MIYIYFSFVVDDFIGKGGYIVNMNTSICWIYNRDCDFSVTIFENFELPKQKCDLRKDFRIKGNCSTKKCTNVLP